MASQLRIFLLILIGLLVLLLRLKKDFDRFECKALSKYYSVAREQLQNWFILLSLKVVCENNPHLSPMFPNVEFGAIRVPKYPLHSAACFDWLFHYGSYFMNEQSIP